MKSFTPFEITNTQFIMTLFRLQVFAYYVTVAYFKSI
jgi:hypothetical protein